MLDGDLYAVVQCFFPDAQILLRLLRYLPNSRLNACQERPQRRLETQNAYAELLYMPLTAGYCSINNRHKSRPENGASNSRSNHPSILGSWAAWISGARGTWSEGTTTPSRWSASAHDDAGSWIPHASSWNDADAWNDATSAWVSSSASTRIQTTCTGTFHLNNLHSLLLVSNVPVMATKTLPIRKDSGSNQYIFLSIQ